MNGHKRDEKADNWRGKEDERKEWKIGFWNVAGLKNKDKDFWKGLTWDVIVDSINRDMNGQ